MLSLAGFSDFARHYFRNLGWCLFLELLRCFSSPGSPRMTMYSSCDTPKGGFPHSEISGSKLICQLPEAYRRLSRLSSPIIAKASTTCSYSLDPITLMFLAKLLHCFKEWCQVFHLTRYAVWSLNFNTWISNVKFDIRFDAIKNSCRWWHGLHETFTNVQFPSATLIRLYEFLKNSRLIKRSWSTTKKPFPKPFGRRNGIH